jgi:putative sigma-54 modulation protein
MKLDVKSRNIEEDGLLRKSVTEMVEFYFSRFGEEVTHMVVRIDDINGPKGGLDKRCQVSLLGPCGAFHVENLSADVYGSIDSALGRAAQVVTRSLQLKRGVSSPE